MLKAKTIDPQLRSAVYERSNSLCEFCGLHLHSPNVHHRWYPKKDTLRNLMVAHEACHHAIHFGGKIKFAPGSLAAQGDTGKGNTPQWRAYLRSKQS
jgi:hypothetical protein